MRSFASSPMANLVDQTPEHDLAGSTSQDVTVAELFGPGGEAGLRAYDLGYSTSPGDVGLRRLVGARLGVAADQVLVTAGSSAALFLLGLVLADDGRVVVATPCFPPTVDALRGLGADVVTTRLTFDSGYRLDVDAMARVLTADTRLVMIASPQNPSGVRFTRAELEDLLAAMSRTCPDAVLLVDETFRETSYGDDEVPESFASLSPRVVTCGSLSKAHGAPGIRIGWLTVTTADLYERLRLAKFNTAITCGKLDEALAVELLGRADQVLAPRRKHLAEALALVEEFVAAHSDRLGWVRPDGGAICSVRLHPAIFGPADVEAFDAELAARRISLAHGEWFGDVPGVYRLGFGHHPIPDLRAALDALGEALRAH